MKPVGGGKRDRTADLLHAMQALSQLSYTPLQNRSEIVDSKFRFVNTFAACIEDFLGRLG
jgi:hypothetical protein